MSALDLLRLALGALQKHRLRTGLSLVGVAIGVMSVVLLTALGEGAQRYVQNQFASIGTNLLIVFPGKNETTGAMPGFGGAANDLTLDDARALVRSVPAAQAVVPVVLANETVANRERRRQVIVLGATAAMLEARRLALQAGSFLPELDFDRGAQVVVLGPTVARELFPGENPLAGVVRVGDARMRVIGVLAPRGTQLGLDMDDIVMIPVATAMQLFDQRSLYQIVVQARAPDEVEIVKQRVLDVLADRHGEEDVTVIAQDAVAGSLGNILFVLTLAVSGIGAVSLAVAGIGIMNLMLVSVSERTAEIGLMRAVGARQRQVLSLFLVEAVLLSSAGGLIGLGLGWGIAALVEWRFPDYPVEPPAWAVIAAALVSLGVGVTFGVLPARRASRLDPIRALAKR